MSGRKEYATGAVIVGLLEVGWLIASNFSLVGGWIAGLQRRGGTAANLSAFVTNPVFHLLMACGAMYLAWRAFVAEPDKVPVRASPVQTQANPQSQKVTINNYPPPSQPGKPRVVIRPQIAETKTNLVFLGPKTTNVYYIVDQYTSFFSARGPGDEITAAIVGFRNETIVNVPVCAAERSQAHSLYYDAQGNELGSILGACWLEEHDDLVDFDLGKSLWVIAAIFDKRHAVMPYYRRKSSGDGLGQVITLENEEIDGGQIEIVEIRIIGESRHELIRVRLSCSTDVTGKPKLSKREP